MEEIAQMGYDMAKDFFLNHDEINACAVREYTIDTEHQHESKFYAEGFQGGDSDTRLAHGLPQEHRVDDVVQRAEQHHDDGRNRELEQQLPDALLPYAIG